MEDLNLCIIDSYNVFVNITDTWRYIISVSEREFKLVIDEAVACACENHTSLKIEIDVKDFCDGIVSKDYRLNDRLIAYIQYKLIEDK